ncbi:hypothetical protein J3F84DRAFT_367168 [Trichoderma pleuroticola]
MALALGLILVYYSVYSVLTQLDPFASIGSSPQARRQPAEQNGPSMLGLRCTRSWVAFAGGRNPPSQLRRSAMPDVVYRHLSVGCFSFGFRFFLVPISHLSDFCFPLYP